MKKNITAIIFLIALLVIFSTLILYSGNKHEVLDVISGNEFIIDINNNSIADSNENFCLNNVESFSLNMTDDFYKKYSKLYNLSKLDMLNLGYLAREFGIKNLLNQKVHIKPSKKSNNQCQYADIYINDNDYSKLLAESGYGISDSKIGNLEKFNKNLKYSKSLNLVILNHHSNKYHKLDCEYGNLAHDTVIIPLKQLPKGMKPCKFCHNILKNYKKHKNPKIEKPLNIFRPPLKISAGNIAIYKFDYTKKLKPDSYCNNEVCKLITKEIANAKTSIDIAIYGYEDIPAFTQALKTAKSNGVKIRFVYDEGKETYYKGNIIIQNIADISKSDRSSPDYTKLMHNKFIVIDNQKVITGSMNFSKTGMSGYDINDVIFINSGNIANLYTKEFEQMLKGKFHNAKLKHNDTNIFKINDSVIEVYFSPQDKSSKRIVDIINNSKNYVYMPTFLITHKEISQALINAHKRGVDIKIIIDANSINTRNSKHKLLRDNGIKLKAENYAGKLHSKTLIADDKYLILGSMNFSNSGENKNDENMLIIENKEFSANYRSFFMYLWDIIPDKFLKYSPKAESPESIGSCSDGVDNDFDGKIDTEDESCELK